MVHKVVLWSGFGIAVRLWQLGLEKRPLFQRQALWAYPFFAGIGGSVGYWLIGVEERQNKFLTDKRDALLAKRRRVAERIRQSGEEGEPGLLAQGGAGVSGLAAPVEGQTAREVAESGGPVRTQKEAFVEEATDNAEGAARARVLGSSGEEKES